jgi:perosamine synthetase
MSSTEATNEHITARLVRESLAKITRSGQWRQYEGENLERLSSAIKVFSGRKHVRLCSSGTFGIELAIRSLKLPPDSEVMMSAYDYPGNFRAIQDAGCRVALFDVQKNDWCPSVEQLRAAYSQETKAVVVSHLHGSIAPMPSICAWAKDHGVFVIEDACQEAGGSMNVKGDWKPIGGFGDLSVLSFGGSKLLSAGRGGAVLTNDEHLAQRMTIYCTRGNDAYALSELQGAVLHPQVEQLGNDSEMRRTAAAQLHARWKENGNLKTVPLRPDARPAYYKFGLMLTGHSVEGTPAHASVVDLRPESMAPVASWIRGLAARGINVGEGFRSMAHRSTTRCRKPETLANAIHMAQRTILLHHSHLLDPETGLNSIEIVATAIAEAMTA